jgi:hypothetical protein
MAGQGTATLDFGAFPGASDASVAVTGQAGILAGSLVEAWLFPAATADHTADEHWVETIEVMAGNVVAGTGFTIYGINECQLTEPLTPKGTGRNNVTLAGGLVSSSNAQAQMIGGKGTLLYGKFNVAWAWN